MARQVYRFGVTVPPGTLQSAPQVANMAMPDLAVDRVRVRVPPGPNGVVGFALGMAGQQIIPYQAGQWIVANDEVLEWALDDFPDSGSWQLIAYNTGAYPHLLQVVFDLVLPSGTAPVVVEPLAIASISPGQ